MGNTADRILDLEDADETIDVDFILAYNAEYQDPAQKEKREVFESNLKSQGLQLEYDEDQQVTFIKIRATKETLLRYAEVLTFKFPLKHVPGQEIVYEKDPKVLFKLKRCCFRCLSKMKYLRLEPRIFYEFSQRYVQLFDLEDPKFFSAAIRNSIVYFILQRQHFSKVDESPINMGIEKLLHDKVYLSAYPLHNDSLRQVLLKEWANLKKSLSLQPLYAVYRYFGAKVALYFAWLGFYIAMLMPLSILGLLCFIYGLMTLPADPISYDVCHPKQKVLMCPLCDRNCDYWELKSICFYANINYLLDNSLTVVFALAMSVWSVVFQELWKQYSAGLVHTWGLTGFSQQVEYPRPQYLSKLYAKETLTVALNASSRVLEPVVPFWRLKFLPSFISYFILVLFICISLIAIVAVIMYRMVQLATHSFFGDFDHTTNRILISITVAVLDLIVISVLNLLYIRLAVVLTNFEYHRTQTEYENSLTIKDYIFQFVNYYSSLFYIAFFKNKFTGYPGNFNRFWGYRQEECHSQGCFMELCVQLVVIMVGKQLMNALIDISLPYAMILLRLFCLHKKRTKVKVKSSNPWTRDYNLEPFTSDTFREEYLKMVIQFGFVVIFGLALPLAPLLALINNIFELRLDALKFLKLMQRPIAQRTRCIGVWHNIMQILTTISVMANAAIIAFSTNFIPKFVYVLETGDNSLNGFLDFTLSLYSTEDSKSSAHFIEKSRYGAVKQCHYFDFRNPPEHKQPYGRPVYYWYIWIGRLAFILIYQNIIGLLQTLIIWAVPDMPGKLLRRIKREEYLSREYIIKFGR